MSPLLPRKFGGVSFGLSHCHYYLILVYLVLLIYFINIQWKEGMILSKPIDFIPING